MALPCTVEIAFGENPFDDTRLDVAGNWTDVTSRVRSLRYDTSSRSDRFGVFVAGTAMVVLDDLDREMDPSNSGSTYAGQFKRDVPLRISGTHSGTDYVQWYGYVRLWTPEYFGRDAVTVVEAVDGLGLLARYELDEIAESYGNESAGARIGRVLDELGFPTAYRDLDNGATLTSTTWGVNALQHCQLAALSDGGFLYAQRDGTITFDGLSALTTTRQLTSQATLTGYLSSPAPVRSGVGEGFRNLVRIGGPAVTTAEVDNTTANSAAVAFQRLDLLMDTDGKAASLANFYADLYGTETPYTREASYTIASSAVDNDTALLPRKIRDRVTVELDPPGGGTTISDQVFIDGIAGTIDQNQRWDVTYTFSSADAYDDNLSAPPADWLIVGTDKVGTGVVAY